MLQMYLQKGTLNILLCRHYATRMLNELERAFIRVMTPLSPVVKSKTACPQILENKSATTWKNMKKSISCSVIKIFRQLIIEILYKKFDVNRTHFTLLPSFLLSAFAVIYILKREFILCSSGKISRKVHHVVIIMQVCSFPAATTTKYIYRPVPNGSWLLLASAAQPIGCPTALRHQQI